MNSEIKDYYDGNLSLKSIIKILLKRKILVLSISALFAVFSIIYSLSLDDIYTSTSSLEIKQKTRSDSSSGMSALSSLTGISLDSLDNKSAYIFQILKSRDFTKHIIKFDGVLENIFAVESYDKDKKKIIYDKSIFDEKDSKWVRKPKKNQKIIPSYLEAHEEFHKNIISFKEIESGFIEISVEHRSPIFSEQLLQLIIKELNNITRLKDISESNASLEYLYEELKETKQIEIRQSINELIKPKLEMLMLADIDEFYSIEPIDGPFTPEERSSPNRMLICILITFFGFISISTYVLISNMFLEFNKLES